MSPPPTPKTNKVLLRLAIAEGLFRRWNPSSGSFENERDGIQRVYLMNADAVMDVLEKEGILT